MRGVAQRQGNRHGGRREHAHKSEALRHQLIESEGGVDREKEDGYAGARDALREDLLSFAPEEIGDCERDESGTDAEGDTSGGADPVVVDRPLEEEGYAEDERDDADAVDYGESDLGF